MSRFRLASGVRGHRGLFLAVPFLIAGCATLAHPERLINKVKEWQVPSLQQLVEGTPVTTSFDDALVEVPLLDGFEPKNFFPLERVRGVGGARYSLGPGAYALEARSYCLKPGTHGPGEGLGYLPAPLAGRKATIVKAILERAKDHPELSQEEIQVLLWAIIARLEFKQMNPALQATASALLTPRERFELDGGLLGLVPASSWQRLEEKLPAELRELYRVEERLRNELASVERSFADIESFAVRTGIAPLFDQIRQVPKGRWSYLDGGFFLRYFPSSYSRTRVEVLVPAPIAERRDAAGRLLGLGSEELGWLELVAGTGALKELRLRPRAAAVGSELRTSLASAEVRVRLPSDGTGAWSRIDSTVQAAGLSQTLLGLNAASQESLSRLSELARWRSALAEVTDAPTPVKDSMASLLAHAEAFEVCIAAGDCTRDGSRGIENPDASAPELPRELDLAATLAVPANRSGQRLGISDQPAAEGPWGCTLTGTESAADYCDRRNVYDRWSGMFRQLSRSDARFEGPLAFYKLARDVMHQYCLLEPGGSAAERALNQLSRSVFEANLLQCQQLVSNEQLIDPRTGELFVGSSLDWALRYVQFEQCVVGKSLAALKKQNPKLHAEVLRAQNWAFLVVPWFLVDTPQSWADEVIKGRFDLANYSHRVTVGYAGIFRKLGKSRDEFRAYLKASPPPKACPGAP
jgi:hypothetical protein